MRELASAICALLFQAGFLCAADQQKLMRFLADANRASISAIQTIEASLETLVCADMSNAELSNPAMSTVLKAKYWMDSGNIRYFESGNARKLNAITVGERTYVYQSRQDGDRSYHTGAIQSSGKLTRSLDPFNIGLCYVWSPHTHSKHRYVDLQELLTQSFSEKHVEQLQNDESGQYCITLGGKSSDGRLQLWLDPRANYLARKYCYCRNGTKSVEHNVSRFLEPARGIFFPESIEHRFFFGGDGKLIHRSVTKITKIAVNQPVNSAVFDIAFGNGTIVFDEFQNAHYEVDGRGRQIGPTHAAISPTTNATNQGTEGLVMHQTIPYESSFSRLYWLSIGVGSVIVIVASVAVVRRRRGMV